MRVVLDDALSAGPGRWVGTRLFTSRDYPAAVFAEMSLDKAELEATGLAVLSRLTALSGPRRG